MSAAVWCVPAPDAAVVAGAGKPAGGVVAALAVGVGVAADAPAGLAVSGVVSSLGRSVAGSCVALPDAVASRPSA
ncbi:MAG: hypothetical protein L0H79_21930, partial [Intrasporangium sp.]|uniref:hypothetical protein n=1 Tax=Intrasporangium sp. TaxID=1925024 RepID=UPI002648BAB6